ncbi:hypothetical protein T02_14420 [Trichinella nativa]|uniref:Uncharacterized protein n=1 Tax=Trichinella nativa TaxID=6335 RepID=A0A0V1L4D3_9BILA|nr:hypothetical protein T02_14420 [Trichinella nativa]
MLATQLCQLAVDCIIIDIQARSSDRLTAKPKSRSIQGKQSQNRRFVCDCSVQNVTNPVGVTPPAPMVLYGRGRRKNNTRIPSTRSSSRHMAALMGSERPRALTLTDGNGCLRRCAGCASTNYFEEAACRKPLKKPERARWPLRDQGKPKAC